MPLWFVVSTVVILIGTGTGVQFAHRRWTARQEAAYEGFEDRTEQDQRNFLLELSRQKLRILGWLLAATTIVVVIGVWYVGGSMLIIGRNADETNDTADGLARIVADFEADSVARDLAVCRRSNDSREENRQSRLSDVAAISRFLLRINVDQERVDRLAADRLEAIPSVEATDEDCDRDGVIGDSGDYSADR